ncbi:hypothetical protein FF38_12556 [Lucilia cuprina]|uniref:MADF domain-containing protein n=1 Tax=Lucilia cuprina TaxID=7375 RepID=A0A0L0BN31_LUCCU|nr:hypothetical protein FF38_12556 [Lucilia cuprina]
MEFIKIEWTKDVVSKLISLWEEKKVLYNTKDPLYHNKHARASAFEDISKKMNEFVPNMTPNEIKTKLSYLRSQYGREVLKIAESRRSGSGADELYVSTAYWFDQLHFLRDFVTVRKGISSLPKDVVLNSMSENEDQLSQNMNFIEDISDYREEPLTIKRKKGNDSDTTCDSLLKDASNIISVLKESCNQPKYDESLVNFFKANMEEITDKDLKDEVTTKVMILLFEYKKKQRQLNVKH